MKTKNILLLLFVCSIPYMACNGSKEIIQEETLSRANNESDTSQQQAKEGPFENVKPYIEILKKENKYPKLVFGVRNDEKNWKQRFDDTTCVFGDKEQSEPLGNRFLRIDLNDKEELELLVKHFPNEFESINFDASVFKFMNWTKAYVELCKAMLMEGGTFTIDPFIVSCPVEGDVERVTQQELLNDITQVTELLTTDRFIKSYPCPLDRFPIEKGAYTDEIAERVQLYKSIRHLSESDQMTELLNKGVYSVPSQEDLDNEQNLLESAEQSINREKFRNRLFFEEVIPKNYVRILEDVFGQGNVSVVESGLLPFPTNYSGRGPLITCYKR